MDDSHNPKDFDAAMKLALNQDKFALGILYQDADIRPAFEDIHPAYQQDKTPIINRKRDINQVNALLK